MRRGNAMSEDQLKGLFGGGEASGDAGAMQDRQERQAARAARREARRERNPDEVARANDFINRYTTGHPSEGYSADEVRGYLSELQNEASPDVMQRAATQTVNNLTPEQRQQFNEMLARRQAGTGM